MTESPGMTYELSDAIHEVLDGDAQRAALSFWTQLPEDLRAAYRDYLDAPEWERWRRWRHQHVAHLLASGADGPGAQGPLARSVLNVLGTAGALIGGGTPRWLRARLEKEEESCRPV